MCERTIFLDALEKNDHAARGAYLDAACAGDAVLRARVEALLQSHDFGGNFLDATVVEQVTAADRSLAFLAPTQQPGGLGRLDHFEVLEVVGRGGMGTVLRARDAKLRRVVALKVLAPHLAASTAARGQFVREAQAAAAIRDIHVVAVHAVEGDGPIPYLVMDYIAGTTLEQRLKRSGPPALAEIVRIAYQIACGLAAAHQTGVVHRDAKPANVLLEEPDGQVKLTDFGLAHLTTDGALHGGAVAGTPMYMSPEQARGATLDHRSDLFSLGSVLYTLCTGRPPFRDGPTEAVLRCVVADTPAPIRAINPAIPAWLEALIRTLHAKEPHDRYPSARAVADVLSRHLAPAAEDVRAVAKAPIAPRRRRAALGVLALAGAVAALGLFLRPAAAPFVTLELRRAAIPPHLLALAGGGDPDQAPAELAAVLGDGRFLLPHVGQTAWMEASPDGKLLAVPLDEDVILFDAATGNLRQQLAGPGGRVFAVTFSRDSQLLAAATRFEGAGGAARVWDLAAGRVLFTTPQPGPVISCAVVFNADGKHLFTEVAERIHVYVARTGHLRQKLDVPRGIAQMRLSPDGRRLAAATWHGNTVRLFDWDGAILTDAGPHLKHPWPVAAAVYSPDGRFLASGDLTGFTLRDAKTLAAIRRIETSAEQMAFTPDSRTLVTATTADRPHAVHTFRRWDVVAGQELAPLAVPVAARPVRAFHCLSRDGAVLFVVAQHDATYVKAIDTATGAERFPATGHVAAVAVVDVSADGRTVASADADGVVKLWDLGTGRVVHTLTAHAGAVDGLAFSPNGKHLASASRDGTIALWDVANGIEERALHGHARSFSRIQFSPDGQTLAAGVKRWEVATGKEAAALHGHTRSVRCVAYHPAGTWLAAGGEDGTLRAHDLTGGAALTVKLAGAINHVAFSADGKALAAVGDGAAGFVYLRDLDTGREITWNGHTGPVRAVAFAPSAPLLATCGVDGTVRFWDRADGVLVRAIGPGPFGGAVGSVAFTPDGRYLATANANGMVYLLRAPAHPTH